MDVVWARSRPYMMARDSRYFFLKFNNWYSIDAHARSGSNNMAWDSWYSQCQVNKLKYFVIFNKNYCNDPYSTQKCILHWCMC